MVYWWFTTNIYFAVDGNETSNVDYFSLDMNTGVISVSEVIDTDSAAMRTAGSLFTLNVMVNNC